MAEVLELADRIVVRDELEVARELQRELLPPHPPVIEGWDVAFSYRTANTIGGDYYDMIPRQDDQLALIAGCAHPALDADAHDAHDDALLAHHHVGLEALLRDGFPDVVDLGCRRPRAHHDDHLVVLLDLRRVLTIEEVAEMAAWQAESEG